ncbi:MAG: hypothetical protein CO065_14675 [Comamonadaceae bacterium CG_4_9_14_0_8_um_filter_57_21]|nr:MAG: hypothetical protein CO065_14675 [Comamonadaceae bacterium CG_4_9_14_0_8_um_filter_57_21]
MTAARGFLGAGDLYISRYNPTIGAFEDFTGPLETTKFEITPKVDLKEMVSKGRTSYGQVIESVTIPQPFEFTVDFAEVSGDTLVAALLGTKTEINIGSGTMTAIEVACKKGAWVDIGHMNIATVGLSVKDVTGVTTYVLGTDYEINYRLGMLKVLPTSAIVDLAVLQITGTYGAVTGSQIAGGTQAQIRAKFLFDGMNFADNLPCIVEVHEAVIAASSAFDFLAGDFASVSLPGRLKTPVGKTEPFVVKLLDVAI